MEYNFRFLGNYDINKLCEKTKNMKVIDWDEFNYRQSKYKAHFKTKYIPIIYNKDLDSLLPIKTKWFNLFEEEIIQLTKKMEVFYNKGYIVRCLLTKLLSQEVIPLHTDYRWKSLYLTSRIHLPIITADNVEFICGGEKKSLKKGELWEINNNKKEHGVINNSNFDRIHLVFDYFSFSKEFSLNIKKNL